MLTLTLVVGFGITILIFVVTLMTVTVGYKIKHTIDPLHEDEEVREFTDNTGEYRSTLKEKETTD